MSLLNKELELLRLRRKYGVKAEDEMANINLEDALDGAIDDVLGYCNRDGLIDPLLTSVRDLVTIRMNKVGVEGELARSEGGVEQEFEEGIPKNIRSKLNRYRIAKVSSLS